MTLMLMVGIPTHRLLRQRSVDSFNQTFYQTEQMPATKPEDISQKITAYRSLLNEYADLPAVGLIHFKLADLLVEQNKTDEALKVLNDALANAKAADIFSTLLLFKQVALFKTSSRWEEALKAIDAQGSKVLPDFRERLELARAGLLKSAGRKNEAKAIYEKLSVVKIEGVEKGVNLMDAFDPAVANEAREALLQLELNVI